MGVGAGLTRPIAVIGAGTTGLCVAQELASQRRRNILIEREVVAMTGAGLRYESRLHFGRT